MPEGRATLADEAAARQLRRFPGRILYLTRDLALVDAQLDGQDLAPDPERELLDNVSTDEITPAWACYYYDDELGRYAYAGLRGGNVKPGQVAAGGFGVVVSGASKGFGSSRETAPWAERAAGIRLIIARSFERIYRQNCTNLGLFTSTDFGLVPRVAAGEAISVDELTRELDAEDRQIVIAGGLFAHGQRARPSHRAPSPSVAVRRGPALTLPQQILQRRIVDPSQPPDPGAAVQVRADLRFTHDYVTAMAASLFRSHHGPSAKVFDPGSLVAFRDHLTFLDQVMPTAHRALGLDARARNLAQVQAEFCAEMGIRLYGEVTRDGRPAGSEGICHNLVIEELAWPGDLVVGTDSHTCMAGAIGCLAFGVGATEMANAFGTGTVHLRIPETVRVVLHGQLSPGVCAKDVMLHLLADPWVAQGGCLGRILEFTGEGVATLPLDERATLTNMAVEAGAFTGFIAPDERLFAELAALRGVAPSELRDRWIARDLDADAAHRAPVAAERTLDLAEVTPMIALPGNPRGGMPLSEVRRQHGAIRVDIAYGGSCTGGKRLDMDLYASVLGPAALAGRKVADHVRLFLQFGSQRVRQHAVERGYLDLFRSVGADLIEPSCGACIRAGPGISDRADQVTVSAINRNFPGRSGPGRVYLASPLVVAASALAGELTPPA